MKKIFEAIGCVFLGLILRIAVYAILVLVPIGIVVGMQKNANKKQDEPKTQIVEEIEETTEATEEDYEEEALKPVPVVREAKEVKSPMEVVNIAGYRDTDKSMYIEVKLSKEIEDKFDAYPYIKIEPDTSFTVSKVNEKLIVKGGFDATQKYKVSVLSGIKANDGTMTKEDKIEDVLFSQKQPKLMFTNDGIILPSVNDKKIYVRSLNVTKMNVKVKKVYANNTTQFLQNFDFTGNGSYYSYYFDNVGDELYDVNFDIEQEMDTWVQTAIDLNGILDGNGIYMVDVSFDKNGTSYKFPSDMSEWRIDDYIYQNGRISKTVLLTDVGIMATVHDDGIRVNVLDIINNNLIKGARVYLMSRNNQILEEKQSDDGIVEFSNHKNSFYILVEHKNSRSILLLKNALSTNGFSVDGMYATNGIRGFIYTERGVYRPGEPIYVSIIARNNDEPLEAKQPVKITVYDPTGVKMIENDVINNGKNGFYTYTFKTDISSRTGIWKLNATIGDEVLEKDISVETVAPNKIKVNLNIPDEVNYDEDIKGWTISSNYLFGTPASDMKYSVNFDIREEPIDFPEYKEYAFKAPSSYNGYYTSKYLDGTLDSEGTSNIEPNFKDVEFGSLNMLADVAGRVMDDGGHNVITKKYLKIKKYDTYIGIEDTNTYRKPGDKLNLKAICVTEDEGKMVAGKTLKCRMYGNDYNWWWDYSDYDRFIRSFKSDKHTTLMGEYEFVTQDVPTLLEYELPNVEYIYVEIEDESTGQITGVNLQASEWVDPSVTKKIETVNVSCDKKKYAVGDIAQVKYKGTKNSKAIITVEKAGKIINQYYREINDGDMIESIEVTKEMAPNVYVYVTLLQDYNTKANDRPLRLYGVTPLYVEDKNTKLDIEIDAPENIRPNEKFTVKIKNNSLKKMDFTIAVVDEGLLDITAFKTPAPWEHFFQKLATKLSLYDNYSEIIDRPYGAINQILKVGGDESLLDEMARRRRLKELGLEDAERFTPVSMFKGVLTTDENGEASVDFDMPNYMGQVRIMVVAAQGNSYGSADKDMIVKAPLIIQPSLPRSMKVGDKLSIPVSVFALEEGIGDVEVYYTFKGETKTQKLTMNKGDKEIVYFEEEIKDEIGKEKVIIGAHSNVYDYEETVGMAINSNNAPIEISENKELKGRQETVFTQTNEYVKGTVESVLTISNKMILGLDQRLKYLIRYPYGCAEQTTSSVFPQLFIEKLSTTKDYNKEEVVENINGGISRLSLFQLADGSFSYWPGENYTSDYATNYIGHFLIYAKKNGYYIPNSMYDNWINYTSKKVRGTSLTSDYDISWKCYALYLLSLAEKQNVSEMNYMYENYFAKMNDTSKMYLATAYKLVGENNVAFDIASKISMASVKKMFDELYKRDRHYYSYSYGSLLREIAVYLDCYYTIYERKDEEAFSEIVSAMRTKKWYSTQTTAYSLLALSNITSENVEDVIKVNVEIDGVRSEWTAGDEPARVKIEENVKEIKVIPDTDGKTYLNYYWEGVPINTEQKDYQEGFSIERQFYDDEGRTMDATNTKSGDTFWLEVTVKSTNKNIDDVENIALSQILPTGWEIENLRVTDTKLPVWIEKKAKNTNVTYTDIRDDRVMWFFDYTGDKDYKFFVKINAVTKGEFDFPGTSLEAMYDNNYRAYKKGGRIKVQ